ncbi:MAG: hypothetical protein WAU57_13780, partial [Xanthobacteraceae bacterium]
QLDRIGIRTALAGCVNFIVKAVPDGINLVLPLRELLYALHDLDDGPAAPFLRPSKRGRGGQRMSRSTEAFRATAAALMELHRRSGMSRQDAAEQTAQELNKLGYRDDQLELISGSQVEDWRDKVNEGGDSLGARRFRKILEFSNSIFTNDREETIRFVVESFGAIARKPIPIERASNQNPADLAASL